MKDSPILQSLESLTPKPMPDEPDVRPMSDLECALAQLRPAQRPSAATTSDEVHRQFKAVTEALARGLTYRQVAEAFCATGVQISPSTLKTYVFRERQRRASATAAEADRNGTTHQKDTKAKLIAAPPTPTYLQARAQQHAPPGIPKSHDELQGEFLDLVKKNRRESFASKALRAAAEKPLRNKRS